MQLTPYIIFNGNCEEALNFYANALGGEIKNLSRYEGSPAEAMSTEKQNILHAQFAIDGAVLFMASDSGQGSPVETHGGMVKLSLDFTDAGSIEQVFAALSESGTITMALQDTFWGARFGMLTDKFGINWMFNYDKPKG